jgi:mycothione reductase
MAHHDLLIIGSGSGNSILTPDFDDVDVAIVERDVFGGTCLNKGCIPSKMFVYAADLAHQARHSAHLGVRAQCNGVDWPAIRDRVFARIDPIAEGGRQYRHSLPNVTVYEGDARMTAPRTFAVDGRTVTADRVVLAAGARPVIPDVPGLDTVGFHTSDTIMRIDEVPKHLLVIGGGFIACELSHVFGAFGAQVTLLVRGDALLRHEDHDVAHRYTELSRRRFDVRTGTDVVAARRLPTGEIELDVVTDGAPATVRGDMLLVAAGREPNGRQLGVEAGGVALDADGYVVTDPYLRTTAEGVWALGDICHAAQLKHAANADARIVAHNLAHPGDLRAVDRRFLPHAVFGHPQVASVGPTERDLELAGVPYAVTTRDYGSTAYGWAMEDTTSFCKLLADPVSRQLLGAHLIGPQASTLIQQLVQGMRFGQTVDEMARDQYYIHPALTEVVEQALLEL